MPTMDVTDEDVAKCARRDARGVPQRLRPSRARAIQDGDFAQVKLLGTPERGGAIRCKPTACSAILAREGNHGAVQR